MGKPTIRLFVLTLAVLAAAAACQRSTVEESSVIPSSTSRFTFDLSASPNILHATGTTRDSSLLKLVVKDGGVPVRNAVVYFSVLAGPAIFSDFTWRVATASNENGIATATLLGPLLSEYDQADRSVIVSAEVEATAPQTFYKEISLAVLGPAEAGVTMSLTAFPAILAAMPNARASSVITAVIQDGIVPLPNVSVNFTVLSGPGMFAPQTWHVTAATDANGVAAVLLLGPMSGEMAALEADIVVAADVGAANAGIHREVTVKVQK